MKRLRVGLLGCGRIGQGAHLPILAGLDDVELVAVAEIDDALRESCRRVPSAPALFADYHQLLDRSSVDAAVICLPTPLHAEAAVACFDRGLDVYLEKPLATSVDDGERVIAAWRRAGTVGAIGFNFRFHPLMIRLRQAIGRGELGDVSFASTVFSAAGGTHADWKRSRSSGGGALLDLASHHVDLARFVFGSEIAEVAASIRALLTEDDTAVLELRLASGVLVAVSVSTAAVEEDRFTVYGSRGALALDRYRSSGLRFVPRVRGLDLGARLRSTGRALLETPRRLLDEVLPPRETSFASALGAFARAASARGALAADAPARTAGGAGAAWPGADLDDGRKSLAVVVAAERSAATGVKVRPEER